MSNSPNPLDVEDKSTYTGNCPDSYKLYALGCIQRLHASSEASHDQLLEDIMALLPKDAEASQTSYMLMIFGLPETARFLQCLEDVADWSESLSAHLLRYMNKLKVNPTRTRIGHLAILTVRWCSFHRQQRNPT
jgi:hypothetical protein